MSKLPSGFRNIAATSRLIAITALLGFNIAIARADNPAPLPQEIQPQNANIRYTGRWDMSDPAAPQATWTCTAVTARFKGTAINARLKHTGTYPNSYYQITVDGQPTGVISPTAEQDLFAVAAGLPDKEHTIEIIRRNEAAWRAPFVFLGFQLEKSGQLLPPPPRSDKRLLVIGDSISCGFGNEAEKPEGNPPAKQNGYMTYGAIAARKFGAEIQIIAWSGRKLFPNNTMAEVYDRMLAQDAGSKANLKDWVPDVVVINLGTNDFCDKKNPPQEQPWIAAYKAFIGTIREFAPKAHIIIASGPMGTPASWDTWARTITADLNNAGDKNITYLPFPTQDVNGDGVGGNWHPNITTQKKMGAMLIAEIEKTTGWKAIAGQSSP